MSLCYLLKPTRIYVHIDHLEARRSIFYRLTERLHRDLVSFEMLLCERSILCLIDEFEEITRGIARDLVTDRLDISRNVSLCESRELIIVELRARATCFLYVHTK
jgi:hypothetical protein